MVTIAAYCLMPTHFHLAVRQESSQGISKHMERALHSYSKFFNTKYGRKGPVWEGKFKNVLVETDEQLLYLTRYIHLNPVKAGLVQKPDQWTYSSYAKFLGNTAKEDEFCNPEGFLNIDASRYKFFTEDFLVDQIALQRHPHLADNFKK